MPDNKITIGNVEITSLSDGVLEFDLCNFLPSVPLRVTAIPEQLSCSLRAGQGYSAILFAEPGHQRFPLGRGQR